MDTQTEAATFELELELSDEDLDQVVGGVLADAVKVTLGPRGRN